MARTATKTLPSSTAPENAVLMELHDLLSAGESHVAHKTKQRAAYRIRENSRVDQNSSTSMTRRANRRQLAFTQPFELRILNKSVFGRFLIVGDGVSLYRRTADVPTNRRQRSVRAEIIDNSSHMTTHGRIYSTDIASNAASL